MDMFRMLQTLEREPQDDFNHIYDASPAPGRVPLVSPLKYYFTSSGQIERSKYLSEIQIQIYIITNPCFMTDTFSLLSALLTAVMVLKCWIILSIYFMFATWGSAYIFRHCHSPQSWHMNLFRQEIQKYLLEEFACVSWMLANTLVKTNVYMINCYFFNALWQKYDKTHSCSVCSK